MTQENKELSISHLFDAPRETVFEAWTDPTLLQQWYAPDGCSIEFKTIQIREGGFFHSCIHDPVHGPCWVKGSYLKVQPSEKLVFTMIMSDENGQEVTSLKAGKPEDWPQQQIVTVSFEAVGKQTKVSIHQTVLEQEAKQTGAHQSWIKMLYKLEGLLN